MWTQSRKQGSFTWNAAGHQAREIDGRQDSVKSLKPRKEAVSKQGGPMVSTADERSRKTGVDPRSTTCSKEELISDLQRSSFLGIDSDVEIPSPNSPSTLPFSDPPGDSPFELLDHILELPSSF